MRLRDRMRKAILGLRVRWAMPPILPSRTAEPAVERQRSAAYSPEREAYGPIANPIDAAKAQFLGFAAAVREGRAKITFSAVAYDGQREVLRLSADQSAAYIACTTPDARRAWRFARIKERRVETARDAAGRLRAGAALESLSPQEDACLRECGAFDGDVLREDFATPWNSAQALAVPYLDQEYLPYGQGPLGTQLYLADMWEQLAKSWWAWHHDPLAKQGVNIITSFVLGAGVQIHCEDERAQAIVDEFWTRETMDLRLRAWATDLGRDGELFARFIPDGLGKGKVRSLDPTTIWEIVTDAEDIEKVYAYAQRYMTRTQLVTIEGVEPQEYIDRELMPDEVLHVKVNASSTEVRGRSDLFVILGYLKRLRDYFDSEVLKAQAAAAYHRDVTIDGSDLDVEAFAAQEATKGPPQPGETWYHNKAVEISMVQGGNKAPVGNGSVYAGLVNLIAVGLGISKEYLGVTDHASLASAEVATDPAFQTFEARRQIVRDFIGRLLGLVIAEAIRYGRLPEDVKTGIEVAFPAMTPEDKAAKVALLATGEGMNWWSKRTAAEAAAGEVPIDKYDFDVEQDEIATEDRQLILKTYEQVPKGYPALTQPAFPPGMVVNPNAGAPPSPLEAERKALAGMRERGITIVP